MAGATAAAGAAVASGEWGDYIEKGYDNIEFSYRTEPTTVLQKDKGVWHKKQVKDVLVYRGRLSSHQKWWNGDRMTPQYLNAKEAKNALIALVKDFNHAASKRKNKFKPPNAQTAHRKHHQAARKDKGKQRGKNGQRRHGQPAASPANTAAAGPPPAHAGPCSSSHNSSAGQVGSPAQQAPPGPDSEPEPMDIDSRSQQDAAAAGANATSSAQQAAQPLRPSSAAAAGAECGSRGSSQPRVSAEGELVELLLQQPTKPPPTAGAAGCQQPAAPPGCMSGAAQQEQVAPADAQQQPHQARQQPAASTAAPGSTVRKPSNSAPAAPTPAAAAPAAEPQHCSSSSSSSPAAASNPAAAACDLAEVVLLPAWCGSSKLQVQVSATTPDFVGTEFALYWRKQQQQAGRPRVVKAFEDHMRCQMLAEMGAEWRLRLALEQYPQHLQRRFMWAIANGDRQAGGRPPVCHGTPYLLYEAPPGFKLLTTLEPAGFLEQQAQHTCRQALEAVVVVLKVGWLSGGADGLCWLRPELIFLGPPAASSGLRDMAVFGLGARSSDGPSSEPPATSGAQGASSSSTRQPLGDATAATASAANCGPAGPAISSCKSESAASGTPEQQALRRVAKLATHMMGVGVYGGSSSSSFVQACKSGLYNAEQLLQHKWLPSSSQPAPAAADVAVSHSSRSSSSGSAAHEPPAIAKGVPRTSAALPGSSAGCGAGATGCSAGPAASVAVCSSGGRALPAAAAGRVAGQGPSVSAGSLGLGSAHSVAAAAGLAGGTPVAAVYSAAGQRVSGSSGAGVAAGQAAAAAAGPSAAQIVKAAAAGHVGSQGALRSAHTPSMGPAAHPAAATGGAGSSTAVAGSATAQADIAAGGGAGSLRPAAAAAARPSAVGVGKAAAGSVAMQRSLPPVPSPPSFGPAGRLPQLGATQHTLDIPMGLYNAASGGHAPAQAQQQQQPQQWGMDWISSALNSLKAQLSLG